MLRRRGEARGKTGREAHRNSLPPLLFTRVCSASSPTMPARTHTHTHTHTCSWHTSGAHSYALQDPEAQSTHTYARTRSAPLVDHAACPCTSTWIEHTWPDAMHTHTTHTYETRTYISTYSPSVPSRLFFPLSRLSFPLSLSRLSPSVWTIGSASSLCLLVLFLPPSPLTPFLPPQLYGEHSLANLPYTFVCLNWVAFYTRAWSVNRILNYYSDCVLPGVPISPGSLLVHLRPLFIPRSNISYCSLRIFAGRRVGLLSASSLLNSCIQLVRKPRTHIGNRVSD